MARRKASLEAVSRVRVMPTYIDTAHQPTDGGTRPVEGQLVLDRPHWTRLSLLLELFAGTLSVFDGLSRGQAYSPPWDRALDATCGA